MKAGRECKAARTDELARKEGERQSERRRNVDEERTWLIEEDGRKTNRGGVWARGGRGRED